MEKSRRNEDAVHLQLVAEFQLAHSAICYPSRSTPGAAVDEEKYKNNPVDQASSAVDAATREGSQSILDDRMIEAAKPAMGDALRENGPFFYSKSSKSRRTLRDGAQGGGRVVSGVKARR